MTLGEEVYCKGGGKRSPPMVLIVKQSGVVALTLPLQVRNKLRKDNDLMVT